jgi:hypothetical protein
MPQNLFRVRIVSTPGGRGESVYDTKYVVREGEDIKTLLGEIAMDEAVIEPEEKEQGFPSIVPKEKEPGKHWTSNILSGIDSYGDGYFDVLKIDCQELQKKVKDLVQSFLSNPNDVNVLLQFIPLLDEYGVEDSDEEEEDDED